jgi:alkylation response protein AidB-like acyl-CoA dehydrogenase
MVEAGRPGIVAGAHEDKLGLRLSNTTSLSLDHVRVPADHLVGQEGATGMAIAWNSGKGLQNHPMAIRRNRSDGPGHPVPRTA